MKQYDETSQFQYIFLIYGYMKSFDSLHILHQLTYATKLLYKKGFEPTLEKDPGYGADIHIEICDIFHFNSENYIDIFGFMPKKCYIILYLNYHFLLYEISLFS